MAGEGVSLFSAIVSSTQMVWMVTVETAHLFIDLFSGQAGMENVSGPVGIAVLAGQAASGGWINILFFTVFASNAICRETSILKLLFQVSKRSFRKSLLLADHGPVELVQDGTFFTCETGRLKRKRSLAAPFSFR